MLASALAFTAMQALVRVIGPSVASLAKIFYRCVISIILVYAWMRATGRPVRFVNRRLLLLRGVTGALAIIAYFWSIDLVGLLRATLYNYSHAVFAILFSALLFGERLTWWAIGAMLVALAGLILVIDSGFDRIGAGDLLGLSVAISGGIGRSCIRQLRTTDTPGNIVLVFMSAGMVITTFGLAASPVQTWAVSEPVTGGSSAISWILVLALGTTSATGAILMTSGYQRLSTATAAILTLLVLPATALIAVLVFGEPIGLRPALGGILIAVAATWVTLAGSRDGQVPSRA